MTDDQAVIVPADAARAVGRFRPDGPLGYAASMPGSPIRATREEARTDWLAGRTPADPRSAAKLQRIEGYAAKWRAERFWHDPDSGEAHPVAGRQVPTDEALAECFANCARVPVPAWYPAIRAAIGEQDQREGTG